MSLSEKTADNSWRDCGLIVLFWLVPALLLCPFENIPYVDDWAYAWPVEWLLKHHELRVLEWSSSPNLTQALWGALFCVATGFSFTALRISTWILSAACLCGIYLLLREIRVARGNAFIGTAAIALNPIFFSLSFTFMTDVPFLTAMIWSVYTNVLGLNRKRHHWFFIAALLSAMAISIRPVGIAIPASAGLLLAWKRKEIGVKLETLFLVLFPLLATALVAWWWIHHRQVNANISGFPGIPKTRLVWLKYAMPTLPGVTLNGLIFLAGAVGISLLPLTCSSRIANKQTIIIFAALLLLVLIAHLCSVGYSLPLNTGSAWEWNGINSPQELIPNHTPIRDPAGLTAVLFIALASSAILIGCSVKQQWEVSKLFLLLLIVLSFAEMVVLWLFNDRYALPIFPLAIALLLASECQQRTWLAISSLCVFAVYSLIGEHNVCSYNHAVWSAVAELRARGIGDNQIDGGYVVNGWLHYAHPENAPRDESGQVYVVGMTTTSRTLPFQISEKPVAGRELLDTIKYNQWLGPGGELYLLK